MDVKMFLRVVVLVMEKMCCWVWVWVWVRRVVVNCFNIVVVVTSTQSGVCVLNISDYM